MRDTFFFVPNYKTGAGYSLIPSPEAEEETLNARMCNNVHAFIGCNCFEPDSFHALVNQ